jgi:hypothetical protein
VAITEVSAEVSAQHNIHLGTLREGVVMNSMNRVAVAFIAALAVVPCVSAAPIIKVNASVSEALAPPGGVSDTEIESGEPLPGTSVSIARALPGSWQYSAVSDITVPKLAIFAGVDNTSGGAQVGEFGGELPLMLVNSTLTDTISVTAPSADPYRITASLEIHGIYQLAGSDGAVTALFSMDPISPNQLGRTAFIGYDGNGQTGDNSTPTDVLTISYDFVGDVTFEISSLLFFALHRIDAGANIVADFSNTAIIDLAVTTLGGAPIPNVVITSSSGNFGTAAPVPVPAALPLLLSALVACGWRAKRRA